MNVRLTMLVPVTVVLVACGGADGGDTDAGMDTTEDPGTAETVPTPRMSAPA